MNTTNNAWERTKARITIAIGSTIIDAWLYDNYTTNFLKYRFVENTKLIINNDDQTIPDLVKTLTD